MKKVTIVLEDKKLRAALAQVAEETGHTVESVAMRALQFWKLEDDEDLAELEGETTVWVSKSKNRLPLEEKSAKLEMTGTDSA